MDRTPLPSLALRFAGVSQNSSLPLMEQGDAMAALRFVEVGGGGEYRHPLGDQFVENAPEVAPRDRIDASGWLIQQDALWDGE